MERRDYLSEVREFKQKMKEREDDAKVLGFIYGSVCGLLTATIIVLVFLISVYY